MRITTIETYFFEYPLEKEFHPSWIPGHAQTHNRCVIIKLLTEEGLEGVGAASCFSEDQARVLKHIAEETIGMFLNGGDPQAVEIYSDIITRYALMLGGRPWLLEVALWDLIGKAAGAPLYRHWGVGPAPSPVEPKQLELYASTGETNTAEHSPAMALAAREAGFGSIKLRAHHMDVADDIRTLEAVREAVGDSMRILVDANQGWSLSPLGPEVGLRHRARVRARLRGLRRLLARRAARPLRFQRHRAIALRSQRPHRGGRNEPRPPRVPDPARKGLPGRVPAGRHARRRRDHGAQGGGPWPRSRALLFSPHTWTNGVGFAINAQIAAACGTCPILEFPWEPSSWSPSARDAMLTAPFLPENGTLRMPDAPGLGIVLDPEAMAKYAKRI